ncbi:MAG: hypothetical protein ACLSH5_08990 [Christensenellales bacterium]
MPEVKPTRNFEFENKPAATYAQTQSCLSRGLEDVCKVSALGLDDLSRRNFSAREIKIFIFSVSRYIIFEV